MLNLPVEQTVHRAPRGVMPRTAGAYLSRSRLPVLLGLTWLLVISLLAMLDAWVSASSGGDLWATVSGNLVTPDTARAGIAFNLLVLATGLAISLALGLIRPAWWRRGVVLAAALPVPILLYTSHNLGAGAAVLALFLPPLWLGRALASRIFAEATRLEAWAIGSAVGLGGIEVVGFILGVLGLLRPQVIWPLLIAGVGAALLTTRPRLRADAAAFGAWLTRPVARRPLGFLLVGVGLAYFWLNLIGAIAPETYSDAVRQRTPTALSFATTGRIAVADPDLYLPTITPVGGELIYAMALAVGPLQSAKLFNLVISLCCAGAVGALGRRLGGARAGGLGALAFATMPLAIWLSQTAYLDLFLTLYAVVALLVILLPERPGWRSAVVAGACIGLGIAVKVEFGQVAFGVAAAFGLAALRRGAVVKAVWLSALLTITAAGVAAPWLARGYVATGFIPGLSLATQSLTRAAGDRPAVVEYLAQYGLPRSLKNFAITPFAATLESWRYDAPATPGGPFSGLIGYLMLGLVPLLALTRPRRRLVLALAGAIAGFGLWFYVAQYMRSALPLLAILCAVSGAGFATARRRCGTRFERAALTVLLLALVGAGVGVQLAVPNVTRDYAFGREDRATYLTKFLFCCDTYPALRLLDEEPNVTRVFATRDPARLYTPYRISSFETAGKALAIGGDDAPVLAGLREGGYSHILIDRRHLPADWDQLTIFDEGFLRRNTVLVGGGENTYLYRILPPDEQGAGIPWAHGPELLPNGGFELANGDLPSSWTALGQPAYDVSGQNSAAGRAAILGTPKDAVSTSVPVVAHGQYLLAADVRGESSDAQIRLTISWRDASGATIATAFDQVPASARAYHTSSMLSAAPDGAVTAEVRTWVVQGRVWFDDLSLRSFSPDDRGERTALPIAAIPASGLTGAARAR